MKFEDMLRWVSVTPFCSRPQFVHAYFTKENNLIEYIGCFFEFTVSYKSHP
jgi:hypothetical protein